MLRYDDSTLLERLTTALTIIDADLAAALENPPAEEIPRLRAQAHQGGEALAALVRGE
jgi:hypothetical protein